MAPSWATEHDIASTPSAVEIRTTDLPHRRRGVQAGAASVRGRRSSLDGLAIGAPLTAAFVGVLLAGQGWAAADGHDGQAGTTSGVRGAPAGDLGAASSAASGLPGAVAAGAGLATTAAGGQPAAIDPVSVDGIAAQAEVPHEGGSGGQAIGQVASEVSAGVGARAGISGGMSVSMTQVSLGGAEEPAAPIDDGAASGPGTIGDHVTGTPGDDVIHGGPGDDVILGGAGDDTIFGHAGDDLLDGGTGNDELFGGLGDDTLLGGTGHDTLHGGPGEDDLLGGTGNDELFGDSGRDELDGGPGNDLVDGGTGADDMQGGIGNDVLVVDNLHDVALDNALGPNGGGADTLEVDDGFAASLAAAGQPATVTFLFSDELGVALPAAAESYTQQVAPGIEHVILTGSADHDVIGDDGANQITGNAGDNALFGGGGRDILAGNAGDDLLEGGGGSDRLEGDAGEDILNGGAGADELHGGDGADMLDGGLGVDQLYGGAGDDTFVFGLNDNAIDTVFDHEGSNQLLLDSVGDGSVQTAVAGDDLYLIVGNNAVAVISDYRGNEDTLAGVDTGQGLLPVADLMAPNSGSGPPLASAAPADVAGAGASQGDVLSAYLTGPSHLGGGGADHLSGTSGADWLSGLAGDDQLQGGAGDDIIEGGLGNNLLEGGAGDDHYLFRSDAWGMDTINDTLGTNVAELHGFAGSNLQGVLAGKDLYVVADNAPLFKVENFVGHEDSFAGVEVDGTLVPTEDLFS